MCRSVRYDFVFLSEFYTKLLICTLGTDVNMERERERKIVYCLKIMCVCVFFFRSHDTCTRSNGRFNIIYTKEGEEWKKNYIFKKR